MTQYGVEQVSDRVTCWRGREVRFAAMDPDDAELVHGWRADPVAAHEYGAWPRSLPDLRELIERNSNNGERDDFLVLLPDGTPVGFIALVEQDLADGTAEIQLVLDPQHRRSGLGTDAVGALVDLAFGELPLHRVEAFTHTSNAAALGALSTAGFLQEGVRREACFHRGSRHDVAALSLLRTEWEALPRPRAWDH